MNMPAWAAVALIAAACVSAVPAAEDDILGRVIAKPAATGVLILFLAPDGAAAGGGLKVGDIITTYGGKAVANQEALRSAVQANGQAAKVEVHYVREGKEAVASLKGGRMGIGLLAVVKGTPVPRHAETPYEPALDNLKPGETFYTFNFGPTHAGFERHKIEVQGNMVTLDRVVRFKNGEAEQDARMRLTLARDRYLTVRRLHFSSPEGVMGDLKREGNVLIGKVEGKDARIELPANTVPSWAVDFVALTMPRKVGACLEITILSEDDFTLARRFEVYCAAEEDIQVAGKPVRAFRYDEGQFGGITTQKWITADNRLVRIDYGGPIAELSTKEAALKGLPTGVSLEF